MGHRWIGIMCAVGSIICLAGCQSRSHSASQSTSPSVGDTPTTAQLGAGNPTPPPAASPVLVETTFLSVTAPPGWEVREKTSNLITVATQRGSLTLGVSQLDHPQTPVQLLQEDLADARKRDPKASICAGPQAQQVPNGPTNGALAIICYIYPATQGRSSFQAVEIWFEGISADASLDYAIRVLAPASTAESFEREAIPVIRSVQWRVRVAVPSGQVPTPIPHQQLCLPSLNGTMQCVP